MTRVLNKNISIPLRYFPLVEGDEEEWKKRRAQSIFPTFDYLVSLVMDVFSWSLIPSLLDWGSTACPCDLCIGLFS